MSSSLLGELRGLPGVAAVDDPHVSPGGTAPDGQTLLTSLRLDVIHAEDIPAEDVRRMIDVAGEAERPGLQVALGGAVIQQAEEMEIGSEALGFAAAALILLATFGSVLAGGLPLLVALGVSAMLGGLVILVVDAPELATILATMIGIALGIDYTLLMVTGSWSGGPWA